MKISGNRFVLSLPIGILFFLASIDFIFLLGVGENTDAIFTSEFQSPSEEDSRRFSAAILKARVQSVVYLFTIVLSVVYAKQIGRYFLKAPHLLLIFAYLLFGLAYSVSPIKVGTNTFIIIISFIAGILFCMHRNRTSYHDLLSLIHI